MDENKKQRDYKKENKKSLEKNFRINLKIDRKYKNLVDGIKENVGITDFFIDSLKRYRNKEMVLTSGETATLLTIIENFIETHEEDYKKVDNGKYISEVRELLKKVDDYYKNQ